MNEELDSQLSAMFDDELPEAECELLARRLSRDEALKERWRRYAIIGAAIRADRGVRLDANLASRVSMIISAEPALSSEAVPDVPAARSGAARWWQPVAGVGVAAGVAALSLMWMREQVPLGTEPPIAQTPVPVATLQEVVTSAPESYTVPRPVESRMVVPVSELANYVVAHSEFSTPLSRRNLLSALVASESGTSDELDESQDAVEDSYFDAEDAP